jgi:hypothetical protein
MTVTVKNNDTYEIMTYEDITQVEEVDEIEVNLYGYDGSLVATVNQERDLITI